LVGRCLDWSAVASIGRTLPRSVGRWLGRSDVTWVGRQWARPIGHHGGRWAITAADRSLGPHHAWEGTTSAARCMMPPGHWRRRGIGSDAQRSRIAAAGPIASRLAAGVEAEW